MLRRISDNRSRSGIPTADDVVERKHPLARCEECPIYFDGAYVPSSFPRDRGGSSPIAFIGEAPGETEVSKGEVFVGYSGRILNAVLGNYGVQRRSVFLGNACACRYPKTMDKLPPEAIIACRDRLMGELALAEIKRVVCMGASAIKSVFPGDLSRMGVTKLRLGPPRMIDTTQESGSGSGLESRLGRVEATATYHPAATLRSHPLFPLMMTDIGKALGEVKPSGWREPDWYQDGGGIIKDPWQAIAFIAEAQRMSALAPYVDTESGRDKDVDTGRDNGTFGRVLCMSIALQNDDSGDRVWTITDDAMNAPIVGKWVRNSLREWFQRTGFVAQNHKYDNAVLMDYLDSADPFPCADDIMLMSYSVNEIGGIHGLDYQGREYLGTPDWKGVIDKYKKRLSKQFKTQGYGAVPRMVLYKYCAYDVQVTRLMHRYWKARVEELGLQTCNAFMKDVSRFLVGLETEGIGFSWDVSRELEQQYDVEIEEADADLPINPRSPKQITEWLEEHKVRVKSTDERTIQSLLDGSRISSEVRRVLEGIMKSRKISKQRGTYVTGVQKYVDSSCVVHTTYKIHGTQTGRLSSSSPNVQNIPRKSPVKRQYVPKRSGHVLVQVDYSQAEFRTMVWLAQEDSLREVFNDPSRDVFTELCIMMFPGFTELNQKQRVEIRTLIKTFAYGIMYGRTPHGIAADPKFGMTVSEAEQHYLLFKKQIPNIIEFQESVVARVERGEELETPFGRRKRFYLIAPMNRSDVHNEAMAFMPQSIASDLCIAGGIESQQEFNRANALGQASAHIINIVHDALYAEVAVSDVEWAVSVMNKAMVGAAEKVTGGYVDFATDAEVGPSWGELVKLKVWYEQRR